MDIEDGRPRQGEGSERVTPDSDHTEREKSLGFPENDLGIERGSLLEVIHPWVTETMGLKVGTIIPVGYDGKWIRYGGFTWTIEKLVEEFRDEYWRIVDVIDFTIPGVEEKFRKEIELRP